MHRPVHPSFGWVEIWGTGKKSSQIIDIVTYALEMNINGVTCVCNPL